VIGRRLSSIPGILPRATALRILLVALAIVVPSLAAAQPDPRQMSGVPLPVGDVANGTVTVRVIRGALSNPVPGQQVELLVSGTSRTATTNDAGRAEFTGLPAGAQVKASTTVDGARLESQEFAVPATGGVRLMLVGALPSGAGGTPAGPPNAASQGPAQLGTIALGDQTRFVFEMGDEALTGFYILQIVNASSGPVQPAVMFSMELPKDAQGVSLMQGSSPQASVAGRKVNVAGPFPPGQTQVQVAFSLPYTGSSVRLDQEMPVALSQVTLLVEKVGDMRMESSQLSSHRDIRAENDIYMLGQGPGLSAGRTLTATIAGLPHAPLWPRNVALALAVVVLAAGAWAAFRPGRAVAEDSARRQKLDQRRERLFADLASLEAQRRSGSLDDVRYASRRAELVRALERVYAALDTDAAA
jgi:hypothetical protein